MAGAQGKKCPVCDKETDAKFRPFCSSRCADVDLGRWLNESYTVPIVEDEDDSPDPPQLVQ